MPPLDVLVPVAGLALLDTLSPATIGITLYVLLTGTHAVARPLFAYLATVAVFYFTLGCVLMLGFGVLFQALEGLADSPVLGWVMVVLGAGMLGYALFMPTGSRRQRRPAALGTTAMIGLGVATGLLEGGTALPYFGAIGIMTTADLPVAVWVPMLAVYNLVMVLPPILLYLAHRLFGERLRPRLERWRTKVESSSREAMGWVIGIAGFLVLRHGVWLTGILEGTGISLSGL
ncbi:GAP family protein [Nocardiopsis sp. ATB16-24]|uniref:GAP family protein n=1 Tax=Nocardiopsis sp. ATB16-24 TaxID=3019555 RepID=UPI00255675F8|nr:GAP family protein [Nocardiopsis sp. ATB16-24]